MQFRLILEGETGKEVPESSRLEFLETFSINNFALSDAEENSSGPLDWGGTADLPLLRTLLAIRQKSREPSFWEVMDYFVLFAYASLAVSRTLLQWMLACLDFTFDSEDLSYWYKQKKKWFLWTMATAQTAENHGDEWGLTWYFGWGIYTSIPTWSHLWNFTKFSPKTRCRNYKKNYANITFFHNNWFWTEQETQRNQIMFRKSRALSLHR